MTRVTSPFGEKSTAAEVAAGHDLAGKRAIVTGANSGIGVETAVALAERGAHVVLAVRDPATAQPVLERIRAGGGDASVAALDLSDLRSVEQFAQGQGEQPLHLLINNAGIMACPLGRTAQGFESQLGVNHLGHFLLTTLLLPALKAANGARVVSVSSTGHHWSEFRFDDPNYETREYDPLESYGQAKSANALFAVELDRRYAADGIRAFSLMPGAIMTALGRYMTEDTRNRMGGAPDRPREIFWKSPEQGAATSLWAALGRELDGTGGLYLENCQEAEPARPGNLSGVQPWAIDPDAAQRLWTWSEEAIAATR